MPEFPLLPIPPARADARPRGRGGGNELDLPSTARQGQRIGPVFQRLRDAFQEERPAISLRNDPASIAPERALVFEIAGSISDFYSAVQQIPGLEYLGDEELDFDADDDFGELDTRRGREGQRRDDRQVGGRLYLAMPDTRALQELLRLWGLYQAGGAAARGFGPWFNLFAQLRALRPWGSIDRIPEETIVYWEAELQDTDDAALIRTEVELWSFASVQRRLESFQRFEAAVAEAHGIIVDRASIPEIGYEGVLIDLPAVEVRQLARREEVRLAICDEVMFLRPQSTAEFPIGVEPVEAGVPPEAATMPDATPIAALFDGMPVQAHVLLDGRLVLDDPDDLNAISVVAERRHGTEMASLILHGDRNLLEPSLWRPLYVRPVLYAPGGRDECTQQDKLLIDTIYRAVRRMKEGDDEGPATAPNVFIVNLSLGDKNRPFAGSMSPWGRLLDHLSNRYNILFVVSAGNVRDHLPVSAFDTWTQFEDAEPQDRERAVLEALGDQRARRTLLSPAEALNIITVGAWHEDQVNGGGVNGRVLSPYRDGSLPNITSAMGLGHRKVIKPDIFMPGGRELISAQASGGGLIIRSAIPGRLYGLKTAIPDAGGRLNQEGLTAGTSAAAALATRAAHRLFDALMDEEGGSLLADVDPAYYAVIVKALLVHRAQWGEKGDLLDALYGPHGQGKNVARKDNVSRTLGYGRPIVEEAMACAPNRATLVGYGDALSNGTANRYRIPLPASLERVTDPRAVILSLAWFSPVNPRHASYRRAKLEIVPTSFEISIGVAREKSQPSNASVPRGSLFHVRYTGEKAVPFIDDGHITFRVFCREQGGALDQSIRYGLAVTIEAGEGITVYQEVRQRLGIQPRP
jgi:Subtilase family